MAFSPLIGSAVNVKPNMSNVDSVTSNMGSVFATKPNMNTFIFDTQAIYLENKTINKGQPIPWGLNWLITYPTTLIFTGVRA